MRKPAKTKSNKIAKDPFFKRESQKYSHPIPELSVKIQKYFDVNIFLKTQFNSIDI